MQILNSVVPIFLVILLGAALRGFGFLPTSTFRQTNRLVFWVALPALLLSETSQPLGDLTNAFWIFVLMLIGMSACILAGYLIAALRRMPGPSKAAFVQGSYRGNLAFVGLPVIFLLLGDDGAELKQAATVAFAPMVPLYNLVAVVVLTTGAQQGDGESLRWGKLLGGIARNPLVLACAAGLTWAALELPRPEAAVRTLDTVGRMALPLALLGIGATLSPEALRGRLADPLWATVLKVGLAPVAGYIAGRLLEMDPAHLSVALIFLACPAAAASYVMADQMDADADLAGGIIVISTALSLVSLGLIVSLSTF